MSVITGVTSIFPGSGSGGSGSGDGTGSTGGTEGSTETGGTGSTAESTPTGGTSTTGSTQTDGGTQAAGAPAAAAPTPMVSPLAGDTIVAAFEAEKALIQQRYETARNEAEAAAEARPPVATAAPADIGLLAVKSAFAAVSEQYEAFKDFKASDLRADAPAAEKDSPEARTDRSEREKADRTRGDDDRAPRRFDLREEEARGLRAYRLAAGDDEPRSRVYAKA